MRRMESLFMLTLLGFLLISCSEARGVDSQVGASTSVFANVPATTPTLLQPNHTPLPANATKSAEPDSVAVFTSTLSATKKTDSGTPVRTATNSSPSPTATEKPPCYRATFLEDVTYRDGTRVLPGEIFLKIWRFRNEGSCEWTRDFMLEFVDGQRFSGPDEVKVRYYRDGADLEVRLGDRDWNDLLRYQVQPGEIVDIAVILRAPLVEGRQRGHWRVMADDGVSSVLQFYVDVEVEQGLEEELGVWSGEWSHQNQWSGPTDTPLVLLQQDRQVKGYYYNSEGEVFFVEASLSRDGTRMEGSFGQIWQSGWPFVLRLYPDQNVFNGYYNDSDFTGGAWCGNRMGYTVPFGECLLVE